MTMSQKTLKAGITAMAAILFAAFVPTAASAATTVPLALQQAGIQVSSLAVQEIEGIVIVRGSVTTVAERDRIAPALIDAGYARVANMVNVATAPTDQAITRAAERELSRTGALEGSSLRVSCNNGVILLSGAVRSDNQRQLAVDAVQHVDGVRAVRADL